MTDCKDITLTASAAKRIQQITTDPLNENFKKTLKVSVHQGGCAGLQYKYEFVEIVGAEDVLVKNGDSCVALDDFSAQVLKGSTVDYIETSEFGTSSFKIINPNACNRCSCGNSFAI